MADVYEVGELQGSVWFHENIQKSWTIANSIIPAIESGEVTIERFQEVASVIANFGGIHA